MLRSGVLGAVWAMLPWVQGQSVPRITAWRAADGLPQSAVAGVSLGAHGRVFTTHDVALPVARLDGFQITTVSNTTGAASRVYASRSEQLWCVHAGGVMEQTGEGWNRHPLPEVAAEMRMAAGRAVRSIPLVPLDRNRVLIVLPDRILEYDAVERRSSVVRRVEDTGLGRFGDTCLSSDDGVWIAGSRGLLRLAGPLRQIRAGAEVEEHLAPAGLGLVELQRPFADRDGGVILAGEASRGAGEDRQRVVVRYSKGRWERWTTPGHNVRQAWPGADGEFWGHTSGAVVRLEPEGEKLRLQAVLQVGRVADVAVENHGVAWIATSEGLFRISPLAWRAAARWDREAGSLFALTSDRRGRVVAVSAQSFHWLEGGEWRSTPWGRGWGDEGRPPGDLVFPLADGGVLVRLGSTLQRVGGDGRMWEPESALEGCVPMGMLADGRVVLHRVRDGVAGLAAYDGRLIEAYAGLPEGEAGVESAVPRFAFQARTGELWLGGNEGLWVRRGENWERASWTGRGVDEPGDRPRVALERADGRILIGGEDALHEFDGRTWRVVRRGFDGIHGLHAARDGSLWVASGNGLHRYREGFWFVTGEEEGMRSGAVFDVFEDGSGRLWAGTAEGLMRFDELADRDPPRSVIAGADLPERAGDQRALFVLGGEDRWRYAPEGRLMYSWRLGNNPWSAWRPTGSVQFTDLTAGTHRFQVRALDPSHNLQVGVTELEFTVSLPWFRDPRLVWTSAGAGALLVALGVQAALGYRRLKRSYAEVERQVAERTAALEKANAELLHSQKMRALGTLAAGVAHDFNSLLSIIQGSAQLLEAHLGDPEKARVRLQRIRTAVNQGAGLVRAMLGFSRRPSQEGSGTVDLGELVEGVMRLVDERLGERIERVLPPAPVPRVRGSPEMLQQILVNLLQNADEAVQHRGVVWIELEARQQPRAGMVLRPAPAASYAVLRVRDEGVGIAPEHLSRIFEPFFTTKGFSSRRGTGLGLLMVHEFAKEMGAGLAVESEEGRGSRFEVWLGASE